MSTTVGQALARRVAETPSREFVRCGGEWLTFADVDAAADRVARGLADLGLVKGDRVAVLLPTRQEVIELFFGGARLGVVQVSLNVYLKGEFLRYPLIDSGARVLVTDLAGLAAVRPMLADTPIERVVVVDGTEMDDAAVLPWSGLTGVDGPPPEVEVLPEDLFAIGYTSGTTGPSKGCMLSHAYQTSIARAYQDVGWIRPGDRVFTGFGFGHLSGPQSLMFALMTDGGSVCYELAFSASTFLARARAERATVLFGLGTMAMAIMAQPGAAELGELRLAIWIAMSESAQLEWERRYGLPVVSEGIGQSECAVITLGRTAKRGSLGHPVEYLEIAVVDGEDEPVPVGQPGELVIRPRRPGVMYSGYWQKPEATAEAWRNLWHHTGDLVRADADGCLHFVDRKRDSIRRRGENVSSFELETAILGHPDVAQVAAVAVPSPLGGDDIKVCIIPVAGRTPDLNDLFEFFKQRLPYFAIPRYVDIRDTFPVTAATGRVQKVRLREEGVTDRVHDLEGMGYRVERSERRA